MHNKYKEMCNRFGHYIKVSTIGRVVPKHEMILL